MYNQAIMRFKIWLWWLRLHLQMKKWTFVYRDNSMPKKLHRKLNKAANKAGLSGSRKNAYVYGTMNKIEKRRSAKRNKK